MRRNVGQTMGNLPIYLIFGIEPAVKTKQS